MTSRAMSVIWTRGLPGSRPLGCRASRAHARPLGGRASPPPVFADATEPARCAYRDVATVEAISGHALVAQRKVVLHRIGGIEEGEVPRDLLCHPPGARAAPRQADRPTHVLDVGVDGHEQPR